jgi:hypothetical protein
MIKIRDSKMAPLKIVCKYDDIKAPIIETAPIIPQKVHAPVAPQKANIYMAAP